jgi:hypothetical protein
LRPRQAAWIERPHAREWAAGRRVIDQGTSFYWTAVVFSEAPPAVAFSRQGPRLTAEEQVYWESLTEETRTELRYVPAGAPHAPQPRRARSRFSS